MRITPCAKYLLIANIAIFIICSLVPSVEEKMALYYIGCDKFSPYQFVTYMFVHAGLMHIFFNMFALFQFGSVIESVWGSKRFFFYYLVCGLGAAATNMVVTYYQLHPLSAAIDAFMSGPTPEGLKHFAIQHASSLEGLGYGGTSIQTVIEQLVTEWRADIDNPQYSGFAMKMMEQIWPLVSQKSIVGASGAVFGLLLAFGLMFPELKLQIMFIPIGIKAKYFVILYGVIELFCGVNDFRGDNIAHFAHLGGMLFGILLILYWRKNPHNDFFNK